MFLAVEKQQWSISQSPTTDPETQFYKLVGILHSASVNPIHIYSVCSGSNCIRLSDMRLEKHVLNLDLTPRATDSNVVITLVARLSADIWPSVCVVLINLLAFNVCSTFYVLLHVCLGPE